MRNLFLILIMVALGSCSGDPIETDTGGEVVEPVKRVDIYTIDWSGPTQNPIWEFEYIERRTGPEGSIKNNGLFNDPRQPGKITLKVEVLCEGKFDYELRFYDDDADSARLLEVYPISLCKLPEFFSSQKLHRGKRVELHRVN